MHFKSKFYSNLVCVRVYRTVYSVQLYSCTAVQLYTSSLENIFDRFLFFFFHSSHLLVIAGVAEKCVGFTLKNIKTFTWDHNSSLALIQKWNCLRNPNIKDSTWTIQRYVNDFIFFFLSFAILLFAYTHTFYLFMNNYLLCKCTILFCHVLQNWLSSE